MAKKIEDRKSFLGGPWDVIKGKNPVLSKGLFKPPLDPIVAKFDDVLGDYKSQLTKKKELGAIIDDLFKTITPIAQTMNKLSDEKDKIVDKDNVQLKKDGGELAKASQDPDTNPTDVLATLGDLITTKSDAISSKQMLNAQILKHDQAVLDATKKARDAYKAKTDAIAAAIKKDEAEADKLEGQVRTIIAGYQKTAAQMDNDSLIDDVRSLLDKF